MLQHELGQGQTAFKWHKRSRDNASQVVVSAASTEGPTTGVSSTVDPQPETDSGPEAQQESREGDNRERTTSSNQPKSLSTSVDDTTLEAQDAPLVQALSSMNTADSPSSSPTPDTPPTLTPDELAKVRAQVASVVALGNQPSPLISPACSSYFIEPMEWMGETLLGQVEGKVRLCDTSLLE